MFYIVISMIVLVAGRHWINKSWLLYGPFTHPPLRCWSAWCRRATHPIIPVFQSLSSVVSPSNTDHLYILVGLYALDHGRTRDPSHCPSRGSTSATEQSLSHAYSREDRGKGLQPTPLSQTVDDDRGLQVGLHHEMHLKMFYKTCSTTDIFAKLILRMRIHLFCVRGAKKTKLELRIPHRGVRKVYSSLIHYWFWRLLYNVIEYLSRIGRDIY